MAWPSVQGSSPAKRCCPFNTGKMQQHHVISVFFNLGIFKHKAPYIPIPQIKKLSIFWQQIFFCNGMNYIIFLVPFVIKDKWQSNWNAVSSSYIGSLYSVLWLSPPLYTLLLCDLTQVRGFKWCLDLSEITWLQVTETQLNYPKQKWEFIDSHDHEIHFWNNSIKGLNATSAHCPSPLVTWICFLPCWPHSH